MGMEVEAPAVEVDANDDGAREINTYDEFGPDEELPNVSLEESLAELRGEGKLKEVPTETKVVAEEKKEEETEAEETKEIVKPWARARILEKEKREKDQTIQGLEHKVGKLTEALDRLLVGRGVTGEEKREEEIDPEVDPAKAILKKIEGVQSELSALKAEREATKQVGVIVEALNDVNKTLHTQLGEDPVFYGALEHISRVMERQIEKQFPNRSQEEKLRLVSDATNKTKLEWARDGKDPVTEMYDFAMTLGFDPDSYESRIQSAKSTETVTNKKSNPDPRKSVERAKARASSVAGLGDVEGSKPRRNPAQSLSKAKSEEEFDAEIDRLVSAGEMKRDRTSVAGTPSFQELFAGKFRRIE